MMQDCLHANQATKSLFADSLLSGRLSRLVWLLLVVSGLFLSGCSSTPKCGDPDHPYLTAEEGKTLRAPAGVSVPEEDFNTSLPDVPAEANQAALQAEQTRGCVQSPPVMAGVDLPAAPAEPNKADKAAERALERQQRDEVRSNTPKAPVY